MPEAVPHRSRGPAPIEVLLQLVGGVGDGDEDEGFGQVDEVVRQESSPSSRGGGGAFGKDGFVPYCQILLQFAWKKI